MSAPSGRLDKVFTECLKHHPEGHAVYENISASDLKPGACGYIDENGRWTTIAQITDQAAMSMLGWTFPTGLESSVTKGKQSWPRPKISKNMHGSSEELEMGVGIPGQPYRAAISFKYQKGEGNGAIMVVDGDVKQFRALPTSKISDWLIENARSVLTKFEDTRKNGIWIITSTFVAERRVLAVLSSQEMEFSWKVEAEAAAVGKVAPSGGWWRGRQDGSWDEQENSEGVVLFFSGVQWRPRRLFRKLRTRRTQQKYLAGEDGENPTAAATEVGILDESGSEELLLRLLPVEIGTVNDIEFKDSYDSADDADDYESESDGDAN